MDLLTIDFAQWLWPFLLLGLLLAALVLAINKLGRGFDKHDDWLRMLDAKLGNLDKDRKATWARHLGRPFGSEDTELDISPERPPLVPPPLPPRNPTLNATDWRDDDLKTEDLTTRQTGRYPGGAPPKGDSDDSTE